MKFGEKLKEMRKANNLTQQQLADRLGVAKSVVSYYENGERFPSYDVLIKIARTFHISTDFLLGLDKKRTIDVSSLNEQDIAAIIRIIESLSGH